MILYRPVGLQELESIYDSGMKAFPARLPQQPIFYPVLDIEYARQIAAEWNTKSGKSAGYVTEFKVEDEYIGQFEIHTVGSSQHQEFWITAEEVEKFNQHIVGHIKVLEAHFGDTFLGFIPEQFGLGGKNVVEQFTLLANSFIYNRMDFYLEIKRNHKAIFLNYPFWLTYDFKNPGLKEKVLKAIKDAWSTSFPKIPLPNPVPENLTSIKKADSVPLVYPVYEEPSLVDGADSDIDEETPPVKRTDTHSLENPPQEDVKLVKGPEKRPLMNSVPQDPMPEKRTNLQSFTKPIHENRQVVKPTDVHSSVDPARENTKLVKQTESHFQQGIKFGLGGKYQEAVTELSKAVAENPHHSIALVSLGVALQRLGEDDRALSCYETALKIDPKYAEAHYFRANVLYNRGNVREAMAEYTSAIGLQPDLIRAHEEPAPQNRLTDYTRTPAEIYRIAKVAHRILDLNKALEENPKQANLLKERAAHYERLLNYEHAIADYSSSLALTSDDADALHARGKAFDRLGQPDRALEDYQRAVAINPQLPNAYISRGVSFGQMGNFRQSIANLTEGIRLAPENPDGYFNRGITYFQGGDFEAAIKDFSRVIQLAAEDETAYYWRGISHEEAGHQSQAIADYKRFLALSQDPRAREDVEQRLNQWKEGSRNGGSRRGAVPDDMQETSQVPKKEPDQTLDLYELVVALGERALNSTWFGSAVECNGERAEELYALTDSNKPVNGGDLLDITSGIRQTIKGDFTAFDPDSDVYWLFIHAWEGSGFYVETNDPKTKKRLKTKFPSAEDVEDTPLPYEGIFIPI